MPCEGSARSSLSQVLPSGRRNCSQPARRIGYEALEARQMLSGVTLITHGFNSDVDSWVSAMAEAIADRPNLMIDQPRYRVEVTDPGHDNGPLSVVNTSRSGPSPADASDSAEIVILLNWTDVAGSISFGGGYHRSTGDIAAAVAEKLVASNFLIDFPSPLAELPFHLIGHSRGASLVGELARQLGRFGVWVDQVTTLDPHPVDGVREPFLLNYDFDDAPMTSWENVTYWDNYWRTQGSSSFDFTGEMVANVFDVQLSESVLSNGGYSNEHSDVHVWYHGTIDTASTAHNGDVPVPAGWYGGSHPERTKTGYHYSRIVKGARQPAGLSAYLGGDANRTPIDWTTAVWPNLLELRIDSDVAEFPAGMAIPLGYHYQDVDSSAMVSFRLDPDRNPYNLNELELDSFATAQTGSSVVETTAAVSTAGAPVGAYYVSARIHDSAGRSRYAYASDPILITPPTNFEVTNTADAGPGSLRQAILDANRTAGIPDTIVFAIPGIGPQAIQLSSPLPRINDPVTFDLAAGQDVEIGTASSFTLGDFSKVTKIGAGKLTIAGDWAPSLAANLIVNAGTLRLAEDGGPNLSLFASHRGSLVQITTTQHLAAMHLDDGAVVEVTGEDQRLVLNALSVRREAALDLVANHAIVQATPDDPQALLKEITSWLSSGFQEGSWNGNGIRSSSAAADPDFLSALGVMLNADPANRPIYTSFADEPVGSSAILIGSTRYGDANLDQLVNGTDYALIDNGFNAGLTGWFNGDFSYDGAIDGTDYALIDNAFNNQTRLVAATVSVNQGSHPTAISLAQRVDDDNETPAGMTRRSRAAYQRMGSVIRDLLLPSPVSLHPISSILPPSFSALRESRIAENSVADDVWIDDELLELLIAPAVNW